MRTLMIFLAAAVLASCGGGDEEPASIAPAPTAAIGEAELRAMDSEAKSNARNAVTALESCFTTVQDYAECEIPARELPVGTGPGQVDVVQATISTYRVDAHSESGTVFSITKKPDGSLAQECEPAGTGDCTAAGTW